ncbi:MAG TPA: acetylglutamate kinase, partial [Thermoanaerobaculia bacterium]|nr:acetylglutamate kinase [Thermoanaerobaculia bacterium]
MTGADAVGPTVVKLGGSILEDDALRGAALEAIAARFTAGERLVVVHGGGKRIDAMLARLGIPKRVEGGLRVTDAPTLDIVVSVLAGLVNKTLVAELRGRGVVAAGLSGADGETLWAEFHPAVDGIDVGYVGRVVFSRRELVDAVLESGMLPLVASVAVGREGMLLNVNADAAAAAIATGLRASRLVFLTDVEGVLDGGGDVVTCLDAPTARALLASAAVSGG